MNYSKNSQSGKYERELAMLDSNYNPRELLAKLNKNAEKVLNDPILTEELRLYVEVLARADPANKVKIGDNQNPFELTFPLKKDFLANNSQASKVVVVTGQKGLGKSLFCKHFRRELLSEWIDSQNIESNGKSWFPLYIESRDRKKPKSEAMFETLVRELSLTEEEIRILQTSEPSDLKLPYLLFIFDGCDYIPEAPQNKIGEQWKNVKILIACREEYFQDVKRKNLLLAPFSHESSELSSFPGSFSQVRIEPFTDTQITCYLRKYCFSQQKEQRSTFEEGPTSPFWLSTPNSVSWDIVKKFENLLDRVNPIDKSKLREFARIPSILWIMCFTAESIDQIYVKPVQPMKMENHLPLNQFVSKVLSVMAQKHLLACSNPENQEESKPMKEDEKLNHITNRIKQQLQTLALTLQKYSLNSSTTGIEINDKISLGELHPLVRCPLLVDIFVAESIEEEIIKISSLLESNITNVPRDLLLNQRLLFHKKFYSPVFLLLWDAVRESRITPDQLMRVIRLSRKEELRQESEPERIQEISQSNSQLPSPFEVAGVNGITILNVAGYYFRNQDFRNICIPGANLNHGIFDGANFENADLKGVNFKGASLEDANFEGAIMDGTRIESNGKKVTSPKLNSDKINNIAFSINGKYFAADIGLQTVIFEDNGRRKCQFQEIFRVPGSFPSKTRSPFFRDDKEIATKVKKYIYIWNVATGQPLKKFNILEEDKEILDFHADTNGLILRDGQNTQTYNLVSEIKSNLLCRQYPGISNSEYSLNHKDIILLGYYKKGPILYNRNTRRPINKLREYVNYCKFSSDGKQLVSLEGNQILISDCRRGHTLKSLGTKIGDVSYGKRLYNCSFNFDGKLIISTTIHNLIIQDVTDEDLGTSYPTVTDPYRQNYSLTPDGRRIAVLEKENTVSLNDIPHLENLSKDIKITKDVNHRGLYFQGAITSSSFERSKKNMLLFKEKGDYVNFDERMINKLFPETTAVAESIHEVQLIEERLTIMHVQIVGSDDTQWINLRKLDLSENKLGEEGGQIIGRNNSWAHLEELVLKHTEIGDKTVTAITSNPTWKNLKNLQLGSNEISNDGAKLIGINNMWVNLETLNLNQNEIGDEGATSIGENGVWKKLRALDLSYNKIGNEGMRAVGANKTWVDLEKLCINSNRVNDKGVIVLFCRKTAWKNLKILELHDNPVNFQEKDVSHIIKRLAPKNLEVLNLPGTKFNNDLLQSLKCPLPESVLEISFRDRGYNDMNALMIVSTRKWINLQKLDLSKNKISRIGGMRIGNNPTWNKLRILDLNGNEIGEEGACAIGKNITWTDLRILNLEDNSIGIKGSEALSKNKSWTNLTTLDLSRNNIGAEGAAALSQNTSWPNLTKLALSCNRIGDAGVRELSTNTSWINLTTLVLRFNNISDDGVVFLRKNSWKNLMTLDLSENYIGLEGAKALANNKIWTHLATLNLYYNSLADEGAIALTKNKIWTNLAALNLSKNGVTSLGEKELFQRWPNLELLNK